MITVIYNNREIDYDSAVVLMDDDVREELHALLAPCTNQEFFDAYVERHLEKYNEPFKID